MVELSSLDTAGASVILSMAIIGLFLNSTVLFSLLGMPSTRQYGNWFSIGQVFADTISCIFYIIECITALVDPDLIYNYSVCQLYATSALIFSGFSIFNILAIVLNPYRVLVSKLQPLSKMDTCLRLSLNFVMAVLVSTFVFFGGGSYSVQQNHTFCYLHMQGDKSTWVLVAYIFQAVSFTIPTQNTLVAYFQLYKEIKLHSKNTEQQLSKSTTKKSTKNRQYTMYESVARRGRATFIVYFATFTFPICYNLALTINSDLDPLPIFEWLHSFCFISQIVSNPIVYLYLDKRVLKNAKSIWRWAITGEHVEGEAISVIDSQSHQTSSNAKSGIRAKQSLVRQKSTVKKAEEDDDIFSDKSNSVSEAEHKN